MAFATVVVAVFTASPLFHALKKSRPPVWAEIVLCLAGLQAVYAVWACTARDWSVARTLLVVNAVVAAIYASTFMLVLATPADQKVLFDLDVVRADARWWCPLCAATSGLLAFLNGRNAHRWRIAN